MTFIGRRSNFLIAFAVAFLAGAFFFNPARAADGVEIVDVWYGVYGLVYRPHENGVYEGDRWAVERNGREIGTFAVLRTDDFSAKGRFEPEASGTKLAQGDVLSARLGLERMEPRENPAPPVLQPKEAESALNQPPAVMEPPVAEPEIAPTVAPEPLEPETPAALQAVFQGVVEEEKSPESVKTPQTAVLEEAEERMEPVAVPIVEQGAAERAVEGESSATDPDAAERKRKAELLKKGARSQLDGQEFEGAAATLKEALLLDPDDPELHLDLAAAYEALDKKEFAALERKQRAALVKPSAPAAEAAPDVKAVFDPEKSNRHNDRGADLTLEGDLAGAEAEFNLAIQYNGNSPLPHLNLAVIYAKQDRREDALRCARKAAELGDSRAESLIRHLESIFQEP